MRHVVYNEARNEVNTLTVYERIKQRRKELGLTAEDVAAALNVSRATIYRYESAEIEKVPITALVPLAKVLHTTPVELMGWDTEDEIGDDISPEAQKIAKAFDKATPKEKNVVRLTLSEYLDDDDQTVTLQAVARTGDGDSVTETLEEHKSRKDATLRDAKQFGKTKLP